MLSGLDRVLAPAPDPARVAWLAGVTFAHRGLHGPGAVENSPRAFAGAIDAGLGIECDVRQTADGRAVVFHDGDLARLTGESGPVVARQLAELEGIALAGSDDTIPSLPRLLARVAGRVPLLIEIKTERRPPPDALCRAVLRDLAGYRGPHGVMSFDPRVGRWFRRHSPATARGLVVGRSASRWPVLARAVGTRLALWRARPHFLAWDVRDLPAAFAAAQRARGLPVLTWTVSTPALLERARLHADGFIAEAGGVASALASP